MELYKRGKTWHIAEGINKAGLKIPRHTTKCKDKEAAKDYLKSIELLTEWHGRPARQLPPAEEPKKKGLTLIEALERWLPTLKRETTKKQYRTVITGQFIAPLAEQGITHLEEVKTIHCRELHDGWVSGGLALNTILDYRRPPNRMYNYWIKDREVDVKNPWVPVAILKEVRRSRKQCHDRQFTDDGICTLPLDVDGDENWQAVHSGLVPFLQGRKFRRGLPADPERFLALVELLYTTGLRRSDAIAFQPDFIDHDCRYRAIQSKTGENVAVDVPEPLAAKLRSLPPLPWRGDDPKYPHAGRYIFWDGTGDDDDEVLRKYLDNHIGRPLRQLGESLGLHVKEGNSLHPHRFRDSFAVNCLNSGMRMEDVSLLLGHKSIKTTERYYCPKVLSRVKTLLARHKVLRRPFLIAS